MEDSERRQIEQRYGNVGEVLHTATILHKGWEMDNAGWIVEMASGKREAFTTSHCGVYPWTRAEAEEKLAELEASAQSIRRALELWPAE